MLRLLLLVAVLVLLALLGCRGAETPSGTSDQTSASTDADPERPSTTLQPGEQVTYPPGEVAPGETFLRCIYKDGGYMGAVVPHPGMSGLEAVAGNLEISVFADGTVKASCARYGQEYGQE